MRDVLAFPIAPKADFGKYATLNAVAALCPTNDIDARRQLFVVAADYSLAEIGHIDARAGAPTTQAAE